MGKQQASLANAAVAATLGGKSKGKVNKWDKWSNAAAGTAAGGGEAPGEAGAAAAGGKKKGGGGKKGGKKGAAGAAGGAGSSEGGTAGAGEATTSAANSDASAAAGDGKMERAGSVKVLSWICCAELAALLWALWGMLRCCGRCGLLPGTCSLEPSPAMARVAFRHCFLHRLCCLPNCLHCLTRPPALPTAGARRPWPWRADWHRQRPRGI